MTDALNYRLGSQAGVLRQQTEKSPWQGSPLSTWKGAAKVVFWLPTMAGKGSDRTVTPVAEEVLIPTHSAPPGSLQPKQLHYLHAQHSLGKSCHRQKKKPCLYVQGATLIMSNSLQPCGMWLARFLCQWDSAGKNIGMYWPMLVVIPF